MELNDITTELLADAVASMGFGAVALILCPPVAMLAALVVRFGGVKGTARFWACAAPVVALLAVVFGIQIRTIGDVNILLDPESQLADIPPLHVLSAELVFGMNASGLVAFVLLFVAAVGAVLVGFAPSKRTARTLWVPGLVLVVGSIGALLLNAPVNDAPSSVWTLAIALSLVLGIGLVGRREPAAWDEALLASYALLFAFSACWLHRALWRISAFMAPESASSTAEAASMLQASIDSFALSTPSYACVIGGGCIAAALVVARQTTPRARARVIAACVGTLMVAEVAYAVAGASHGFADVIALIE